MRDVALFARLLALPNPWRVERVGFGPAEQRVDLWLAHRRNATFTCPECGPDRPSMITSRPGSGGISITASP